MLYIFRDCILHWLKKTRIFFSNTRFFLGYAPGYEYLDTIEGEIVERSVERLKWSIYGPNTPNANSTNHFIRSPGKLYISNYRLTITSQKRNTSDLEDYHSRYDVPMFFNSITIPLGSIQRVQQASKNVIIVNVNDFRTVFLSFPIVDSNLGLVDTIVRNLQQTLSSIRTTDDMRKSTNVTNFAFHYRRIFQNSGWAISDIQNEYIRSD